MNPILFLLCHLVGDYILQSDWMALNKNKKTLNCLVHVLIYTSCFLFITRSWIPLAFIAITHFIIDRFPIIVKSLIYIKNYFPTGTYASWNSCDVTGYYDDMPHNNLSELAAINDEKRFGKPRLGFITCWLYIISDNILHLVCNYIALTYL
jgi:hypothetical protein